MKRLHQRHPRAKIGILGGGQLARMLALAAAPLGMEVHVLSDKADDPAAQVTSSWHQGSPHSEKDLRDFCDTVDLLTFESEFVDMDTLEELVTRKLELRIFPRPQLMRELQDRSTQKALLKSHGIPTAPHMDVSSLEDLEKAHDRFHGTFVLKKARGGYDGYGTYYCRSVDDLSRLQALLPERFIAEPLVAFKQELAILLARSSDGSLIHFPLVKSQQTHSRCDWVVGPVAHSRQNALLRKLKAFVKDLNYVGVIAFELFDTGKELLVNEVAPRVHNSAHYSLNALTESQFLLHVKAGLGEKLTAPQILTPAFCMINLLGQSDHEVSFPASLTGHLHWYGKDLNRPGRKMGHINYLGKNKKTLLATALKERKNFKL